MVWQAGQLLFGNRYTIQGKIGNGGFGITYLAKDSKGLVWVVKTLKDEVITENTDDLDKYLNNFREEALNLSLCRHPHIVKIENVFKHEGWLPCIVMEYIQGMDLWQRLKQQGKLPEAEAVRYIRQIGEALIEVHDKGLLHRDLKPQNIMVRDSTNEAVLIDFGIAREFIPDLTQTHTKNGTFGFAPVEQYNDQAHRGEFTDVYALAATLATLVSGRVPQPSFNRLVRDNFRMPTEVSPTVHEAIKQGMAVQPEDRTQTVEAWLEILQVKSKTKNIRLLQLPKSIRVSSYYEKLERLLQEEKWKEADEETARVMLEVANRTEESWLDRASIDNFPCEDLRAIDGLWVKYSNGLFGFSVQKRIYQSLGGTKEYNSEIWNSFGDKVGWRKGEKWFDYKDIILNIKAPEGHLPFVWTLWGWGRVGCCGVWVLFSRISICKI